MTQKVLLINPWAFDFAAFDLWAKPMGLLYLSTWLKKAGADVYLVDCLDRLHPESGAKAKKERWIPGTGQWKRTPLSLPEVYRGIPRRYCRYGLPIEVFRREAAEVPKPDVILVGSSMTYWYPGVHLAIEQVREIWPQVPVILGGNYPTLCQEHARRHAGADLVVRGPVEMVPAETIRDLTGFELDMKIDFETDRPDLDLYPRLEAAPLMTSRGCPFRCPYCASHQLFGGFLQRPVDGILAEIEDRVARLGIRHFAFYDDALLLNAETHLVPLLEAIIHDKMDVRFHAPNGLHVGAISSNLARLMYAAGFKTLRLGLETLEPDRRNQLGKKVPTGAFRSAVINLKKAGFKDEQIGIYILMGLPGQPLEEVLTTTEIVRNTGGRPYLAEYSPLPGTKLWHEAVRSSPFPLEEEPLFHNNSFFPCRGTDFTWERAWAIKRKALGQSA